MCGIVGGVAQRDVVPILLEGLKRLEYRGYDSAGMAVLSDAGRLDRVRTVGKVAELEKALETHALTGNLGIAHTRWATHGKVTEPNAHPHFSHETVGVVHNGIIENHAALRERQQAAGFEFSSDTDTEVVAHQIYLHVNAGLPLLEAVRAATADLEGAYALGVISTREPGRLVVARRGSPLVIGVGIGEYFIASDISALLPVTQQFIYLEEGDLAELTRSSARIFAADGTPVERPRHRSKLSADAVELGHYRHYMLKEIYEQPAAIAETLEGRISADHVLEENFGPEAAAIFDRTQAVHIVACGTSYHAGLVARYWIESLARIPCSVEVASEFRYRAPVVPPGTLLVSISQSGETADTLAAVRVAEQLGYAHTLAICNVPESSLARESDLVLMTRAGPEIGVASTKAFTTQLTALLLLTVALARRHGLSTERETELVQQMRSLPARVEEALGLDDVVSTLAERLVDKEHVLFLGRGAQFPVAMEGALKLKEISYIHAEAYAAGELKHGPLALIDADMPVIAVAPNDQLLEKLKSNLEEVSARGGQLYVFADSAAGMRAGNGIWVQEVAPTDTIIAPIIYTIPLQLLAYHVAVLKGTDVDHPRNLAKAVTVE